MINGMKDLLEKEIEFIDQASQPHVDSVVEDNPQRKVIILSGGTERVDHKAEGGNVLDQGNVHHRQPGEQVGQPAGVEPEHLIFASGNDRKIAGR